MGIIIGIVVWLILILIADKTIFKDDEELHRLSNTQGEDYDYD